MFIAKNQYFINFLSICRFKDSYIKKIMYQNEIEAKQKQNNNNRFYVYYPSLLPPSVAVRNSCHHQRLLKKDT